MQHNLKAYSIKDIKSQLFSPPHFTTSDGVAIRDFSTVCEDPQTKLNKFPEDFALYHMGHFDVETGELNKTTPKSISNATDFAEKEPKIVPPKSMYDKNLI